MDKFSKLCIDIFAGAGGLAFGLQVAGWEIVAGVDSDYWAAKTFWHNFPGSCVTCADVRDLHFKHLEGIGLLAGGPPCQPFSIAGKQLAKADIRDMVPEFIRVVKEAQPKAFLMENVPGLMADRNAEYRKWVISQLKKLNYDVHIKVLNAAAFGVPQYRKRVFFVGLPEGTPFLFPEETHGPNKSIPYVTTMQSIKRAVKDDANNSKVIYAKKPVLRPSAWSGMLVNGKGRPIKLDEPCPTIPASTGGNRTHIVDINGILFEYHEYLRKGGKPRSGEVEGVRRLTTLESAKIQSFPDEYIFWGPKSARYRLIGNAVPPLLAKAIGESIYQSLFA